MQISSSRHSIELRVCCGHRRRSVTMDEVDKVWNGGLGEKLGGLVRRPFACSIEGLDSTDSCVARIAKEDTM